MDLAYDHIQEDSYPRDSEVAASSSSASSDGKQPENHPNLNEDLQQAYKALSASPWGVRIGGFFGNVVKQGESVYREAQQELSAVGQDASRGFADLTNTIISRTRSLSINTALASAAAAAAAASASAGGNNTSRDAGGDRDNAETTPTATTSSINKKEEEGDEASGAAAKKDDENVLTRLREEAAKRLRDLQRAEDAADEALLRFGSNLRDFLRDAIKIAPPSAGGASGSGGGADGQGSGSGSGGAGAVLFESKDAQGKRVIHASRFDAQLHVIHTTAESFAKDPTGPEYDGWCEKFDADKKTSEISADLAKYPELRSTMEKLVPDRVAYADFWRRYYFLRHGIETAEARRRDLLKAASAEEEVRWDDDDEDDEDDEDDDEEEEEEDEDDEDEDDEDDDEDDEEEPASAPPPAKPKPKTERPGSTESSTTIHPPSGGKGLLKPLEPRKSNDEKSQADSDASYDVVGAASGVPSQAPSSPKESRKGDDSDEEEDWE